MKKVEELIKELRADKAMVPRPDGIHEYRVRPLSLAAAVALERLMACEYRCETICPYCRMKVKKGERTSMYGGA